MVAQNGQWRIEVRTFRVGEGTNFAHSYLAVLDGDGKVQWEIHGHPSNGGPPDTWSSVEADMWQLATEVFQLHVFIFETEPPDPNAPNSPPPHHGPGQPTVYHPYDISEDADSVLGPRGRSLGTIWTGTPDEALRILAGMRAVRDEINNAQLRYEILGLSAGDARNSNAVTRTMIDFIRDFSVGQGIGTFGLPRSVVNRYWRELQALEFDKRADRADWIREAEATGIPLQLLDDTIQNDDGYAALAPGIHRNLIKIDPRTGLAPDTIEDSLVYPPSLNGLVPQTAPRRARLRQASREPAPGATGLGATGSPVAAAPAARDGNRAATVQAAARRDQPVHTRTGRLTVDTGASGPDLSAYAPTAINALLTVPGAAMSGAQRVALMTSPAFSDRSDPMFGPAVWKYRDANAHGAERAVTTGAVDAFGRPARPVFADTDGAPADADGRPMDEALAHVKAALGEANRAVGTDAAVAALQGAVNDVGDAHVLARTPPEGEQANRVVPRIAVDGVAGPRTAEAVRLALHHAGGPRLDAALSARLGRVSRAWSYA